MEIVEIAGRPVGQGAHCFIIAEAGSNHDQDFDQALKLIDIAADAGADAVKFQVFSADKIAADTADKTASLAGDQFSSYGATLYDLYKKLEMPRQWLRPLKEHADARGIIFSATPFDEQAVDALREIDIAFYKISSFEIVHIPLIKKAASAQRPIILSTGMATLDEIREAVDAVEAVGNHHYALLHCGIDYPPRMDDIHLAAMDTMRVNFKCPIGYSDHTLGLTVPVAAVARGASIIEKHFTVDRTLPGPDHGFALDPGELKAMTAAIRATEKAIGKAEKKPVDAELPYLKRGRRSLFAARPIKRGEIIDRDMVAIVRPAIGIAPKHLEAVVGRRAKCDIDKNDPITWERVES